MGHPGTNLIENSVTGAFDTDKKEKKKLLGIFPAKFAWYQWS